MHCKTGAIIGSRDYASLHLYYRLRLDEQHPHEAHDQHEFNNNGSYAFGEDASAPYGLIAVVSARAAKAPIIKARKLKRSKARGHPRPVNFVFLTGR
jgi:hypothetical protein